VRAHHADHAILACQCGFEFGHAQFFIVNVELRGRALLRGPA
jgi:hypothetical protein